MIARLVVCGWLVLAVACAPGVLVRPVAYRLPGRVASLIGGQRTTDGSVRYGQMFCRVMAALLLEPGHGDWDSCATYLEMTTSIGSGPLPPAPSLAGVRVLLVGGLFGDCLARAGVTLFQDAARALMAEGVIVDTVPPLDDVAMFIWDHPGSPYIAVGYSKGAGDLMDALMSYPDLPIRALVTVAGSVGGSRLPDQFPEGLSATVAALGLAGCDATGLSLVTRANRQAALARYISAVPAFSLAAVADTSRLSTVLRPTWEFLSVFSLDQDSQVIAEDAVMPGATFLGIARADHWAVALPFDEVTDPQMRQTMARLVDHNTFPRVALLKAIVQYVISEAP